MLYWYSADNDELKKSSMRESRILSLYAAQYISMEVADYKTPAGQKLIGDEEPPLAVLATPDGTVVNKALNKSGALKVSEVERIVQSEVKKREDALDTNFKEAKDKAKAGDNAAAIQLYRAVLDQKCMSPKKAKDAAKELKKLGVTEVADVADAPVFDARESARIERTMRDGLKAEINAKYAEAERLYTLAHRLDPADPVPLRYLGELYRHHTGEWDKAIITFEAILRMPSVPLSRAVAQHGLGKITIHEGEFKKAWRSLKLPSRRIRCRSPIAIWRSTGIPRETLRRRKSTFKKRSRLTRETLTIWSLPQPLWRAQDASKRL